MSPPVGAQSPSTPEGETPVFRKEAVPFAQSEAKEPHQKAADAEEGKRSAPPLQGLELIGARVSVLWRVDTALATTEKWYPGTVEHAMLDEATSTSSDVWFYMPPPSLVHI